MSPHAVVDYSSYLSALASFLASILVFSPNLAALLAKRCVCVCGVSMMCDDMFLWLTSAPLSPLSDTLVSTLAVVDSCPPVEVGGAAPPTMPPLALAAGTRPLHRDKISV